MRRLLNNIGVLVSPCVHNPALLVAVLDEAQALAGSRPAVAR